MRSEGLPVIVVGRSAIGTRSVGLCLSLRFPRFLSNRTVAAVDTKLGYVGMCNGRSAQYIRVWSGVEFEYVYLYGAGLKSVITSGMLSIMGRA